MNLKGTKFQLKVWNYLRKIPKGKVKTYLEVAKAIGKPRAFRAVANAVGKNPYPPKALTLLMNFCDLVETRGNEPLICGEPLTSTLKH